MSNGEDNLEVGATTIAGLLNEFRNGNIANKKIVRQSLERQMAELSRRWDKQFPGFPKSWFPYLSFAGLNFKEARTAHLKKIIIQQLMSKEQHHGNRIIVNPACFLGRRARSLASRMKSFKIIATDINPGLNSFWKYFCKTPANYEFRQDSVFSPKLKLRPSAVVFFGACGSVTDAAMDYFIKSDSPYLFCRTCCQHNIGGNVELAKGFNLVNWMWGLRKPMLLKMRKEKKGYYFSPNYLMEHLPRSLAAKGLTNSDEFLEISRHAASSGICKTIIDLDRYLYLAERKYNVWYREEMFVAEKNVK